MMISGASSSISLLSLLFLFITRLYKSFTSLTANFPPSRATKGLRSGGNTGKTVIIIHSGLFPLFKKSSVTFSLLTIVFFFASEFVESISFFNFSRSSTKSSSFSKSLTTSPPILASKPVPSYLFIKDWYCSSFKTSFLHTCFLFSLS